MQTKTFPNCYLQSFSNEPLILQHLFHWIEVRSNARLRGERRDVKDKLNLLPRRLPSFPQMSRDVDMAITAPPKNGQLKSDWQQDHTLMFDVW